MDFEPCFYLGKVNINKVINMTYRELFEEAYEEKPKKVKHNEDELKKGRKVEKEHSATYQFIKDYYKEHGDFPPDSMVFERIAADHLSEIKNYYTLLLQMEKQAGK